MITMHRWFPIFAVGFLISTCMRAQLAAPASKPWHSPRTPDGHPDLQGVYSTATLTPLERPAELGATQFFTEKEAADYENGLLKSANRDRRDGGADTDVGR